MRVLETLMKRIGVVCKESCKIKVYALRNRHWKTYVVEIVNNYYSFIINMSKKHLTKSSMGCKVLSFMVQKQASIAIQGVIGKTQKRLWNCDQVVHISCEEESTSTIAEIHERTPLQN